MLKSSGIQQIKKKRRNKELGITLIALVITIIVILILAGASITMMTGDNGMLNQAVNAKEENIIGQEKEQVEMAYISATINKMGDVVTEDELQKELERLVGEKKTETIDIGDEILIVEFMDTQHCYSIEDGIVLKYVNVNVSELEKKLDEYKDIVNQINIYTESTYNDFLEQYKFAKKIVEEGKGTENVIKCIISNLEEKYNVLKYKQVPVIKKFELSTDGTKIILKIYTGDNFGDYYQVVKHGVIFYRSSKLGSRNLTVSTPGSTLYTCKSYVENMYYQASFTPAGGVIKYAFRAYVAYVDTNRKDNVQIFPNNEAKFRYVIKQSIYI